MSDDTISGPGSSLDVDTARRRILEVATGAVAGTGAVVAAWPFLASMRTSAKAEALGAPVEVDISTLQPGELRTYEWRGKPVWVLKRTPEMLATLKQNDAYLRDPKSSAAQQPPYAANEERAMSGHEDIFVVVGICTHLGCSPMFKPQHPAPEIHPHWQGGFFCPCHGSKFDLAGRVYQGVPAPLNLVVPPYRYASTATLIIGEDEQEKTA